MMNDESIIYYYHQHWVYYYLFRSIKLKDRDRRLSLSKSWMHQAFYKWMEIIATKSHDLLRG